MLVTVFGYDLGRGGVVAPASGHVAKFGIPRGLEVDFDGWADRRYSILGARRSSRVEMLRRDASDVPLVAGTGVTADEIEIEELALLDG